MITEEELKKLGFEPISQEERDDRLEDIPFIFDD